ERYQVTLREAAEGDEGQSESRYLLLMVEPRRLALEQPETAKARQTLSFHSDLIGQQMEQMADALSLEAPLKDALITAARWHDRGKSRPIWQRFACNLDST